MASILIIDDNDAVRTALEVLISLQGHRVLLIRVVSGGRRTCPVRARRHRSKDVRDAGRGHRGLAPRFCRAPTEEFASRYRGPTATIVL